MITVAKNTPPAVSKLLLQQDLPAKTSNSYTATSENASFACMASSFLRERGMAWWSLFATQAVLLGS